MTSLSLKCKANSFEIQKKLPLIVKFWDLLAMSTNSSAMETFANTEDDLKRVLRRIIVCIFWGKSQICGTSILNSQKWNDTLLQTHSGASLWNKLDMKFFTKTAKCYVYIVTILILWVLLVENSTRKLMKLLLKHQHFI